MKWTLELLIEAAKPYNTRQEFRRGNQNAYSAARVWGVLDQICEHMAAVRTTWTLETLAEAAKPYNTRQEFLRGNAKAYQAAYKRGLLDQICGHMVAVHATWTLKLLAEAAKPYNTRQEFKRGNRKAYQTAHTRGLLDHICGHMDTVYATWTLELLAEAAKPYNTRQEFSRGNPPAYSAARGRGVLDQICGHMLEGQNGHDEDQIYIWKAVGEFYNGAEIYKIGITSAKLNGSRITNTARKNGQVAEVIILTEVQDARALEKKLHTLGADPKLTVRDGRTEFRALTDDELNQAIKLIKEAA